MMSAIGIGLPLVKWIWGLVGWPMGIEVSKETTWLTEPVAKDGYVDYLPFLSQRHHDLGVRPTADDPWIQMHTAEITGGVFDGVATYRYAGSSYLKSADDGSPVQNPIIDNILKQALLKPGALNTVDRVELLLFALRHTPWTAESFPQAARAVQDNAEWYEWVVEHFSPVSSADFPVLRGDRTKASFKSMSLPSRDVNRTFARRFLLWSTLQIGEGDLTGGFKDIAFLFKVARRDRCFPIGMFDGARIEKYVCQAAVRSLLSGATVTPSVIRIVNSLPIEQDLDDWTDVINVEGRIWCLEELQRMHRVPAHRDFLFNNRFQRAPGWVKELKTRRLRNTIDWNELLKTENKLFDRLLEAVNQPDFQTGWKMMEEIRDHDASWNAWRRVVRTSLWDPCPSSEDVLQSRPWRVGYNFDSIYLKRTLRLLRRRVLQIIVRLAAWKQQHGQFPQTLEPLNSLEGFVVVPDLFIDPYVDHPLLYERTPEGFEIRSVGANGVVNKSGLCEISGCMFPGEDWDHNSRFYTGDHIWHWPLAKEVYEYYEMHE